ncbi:hypothetical protein HUG17_0385 [Dermatophagoides farinae]|uniref:Uncharacterized protein n=1 Tax=Dermatophagoides farinae TaxID=6954 RepID=A0A9D4P6V9_DERFA|nr:hypothetical protein HUG17_0385 [Dermatophagoides farinae]
MPSTKLVIIFVFVLVSVTQSSGASTRNLSTWQQIKCQTEHDCQPLILDSMCLNGRCLCIVNHRMNDNRCEPFLCKLNNECYDWDENMICDSSNGRCRCPSDYQINELDQRCHQLASNMSWFLVVSLLPLILVLLFCLSCTRLALTNTNPRPKPPPYRSMT